jgi:elongation factor G
MPDPSSDALRNIGIFAHIDAGKTSLTERILYLAGRLRQPGTVDSGTTTTDYLKVERERGITVKAACVRLDWRGSPINLIDTPGHVDFGAEVERSMRVLDGLVIALCAVAGVQSRTEGILKTSSKRDLPRIAFVNKMDRKGASFVRASAELAELDPRALPVQLPLGEGSDFRGILDLASLSLTLFPAAGGEGQGEGTVPLLPAEIPGDLLAAGKEARSRLVEALAEGDESMLAAYAEGREPGAEELRRAIRAACVAGRITPVLCGSAFIDGSVAFLLDAVREWLPSPAEAGCPEGTEAGSGLPARREASAEAPFSSFVFKTQAEAHFGRLSWLRIWSGRLAAGDRIVEAGTGIPLRVQRIFAIQAESLEDLPGAVAGDIVAVAFGASGKGGGGGPGGKAALGRRDGEGEGVSTRRLPGSTGSSLCAPSAPILYEALDLAEPVVSLALEPHAKADAEALLRGLSLILEEDPSLRATEDGETGRITLSGMGELHLEVAVERLRSEQGVRLRAGRPQVARREALDRAEEATCDFDRDMNGERIRAQLTLSLAPRPRGSGLSCRAAAGLKVAPAFLAAFTRGIEAALSAGPAGGWPIEDVEATLLSLTPPSSRQAELAMEIAASMAAHEAMAAAGTTILEPWIRVEISAPEDCLGPAVAALTGRGGRVESIEDAGSEKNITAAAPLRLLFGFETELRSATAGRASHQARFLRYEAERQSRA